MTNVNSPAVGRVVEVLVEIGALVALGDELVVIESMKVEIPVVAPAAGRVTELVVQVGTQMQVGDRVAVIQD